MGLPVWTNAQVISQLDSGSHLTGSVWTFAFPTSNDWIPTNQAEYATFTPLNAQQQTMATLAVQLWDDLIRPAILANGSDPSSTIKLSNMTTSDSYAYAYYPDQRGWEGSSAWFNTSYRDLATPATGNYANMSFIHELGHALGLNHMGNYDGSASWPGSASSIQDSHMYSVMSYFTVSETGQAVWSSLGAQYFPQTPMLADIMAIQAIYGADTTTRATDTTYGFHASGISQNEAQIYDFTQNAHPIMTLYDAGGVDTLDLSGFSQDARVDLVAGRYSSAAGFTNNIAIAYNTTIENAAGGAGNDTLLGNAANNRLSGGDGNDRVEGFLGNDFLDGGSGNDVMLGGLGNDTYGVDSAFDTVTELFNQGIDTIRSSFSYTLGTNVENLTLIDGAGNINATGNAVSNVLTGNNGNNILDGGRGVDTMNGGAGNDTYLLDNYYDVVNESAFGGTDTIVCGFSKVLGANVENLTLTGSLNLIGYGNALDNVITGNNGSDRLSGGDGNDWLLANGGNDILTGGNGNDYIRGGAGNDTMSGGMGSDTFRFDARAGLMTRDVILDFRASGASQDHIMIGNSIATSYEDFLTHATLAQSGTSAILTIAGNQQVVLANVNVADLGVDDFTFA